MHSVYPVSFFDSCTNFAILSSCQPDSEAQLASHLAWKLDMFQYFFEDEKDARWHISIATPRKRIAEVRLPIVFLGK